MKILQGNFVDVTPVDSMEVFNKLEKLIKEYDGYMVIDYGLKGLHGTLYEFDTDKEIVKFSSTRELANILR